MNIKHYLSAFAALSMLAACSDYDPGTSGEAVDLTDAEVVTLEEYKANFIERYGTPAENQTWGFGAKGSESEIGTRHVDTGRNNWTVLEDGTLKGVAGTWTDAYSGYFSYNDNIGWNVPGFPSSVDGLYYIEEGNVVTGYTEQDMIAKRQQGQVLPAGDVTDEEIQYVSEWFRTHREPDFELPQFTEFFIQEISKDKDRVIEGTGKTATANGAWVDWQHIPTVWEDDGTNAGSESIDFSMDYLAVETSGAEREHLNNYNSGNTNPIAVTPPTNLATDTQVFPYRTLKYWTSNGGYTTDFVTHSSGDNTDYKHYVLVHLSFDGPRTGNHYDGYYLAFDYELHKSTTVWDGNTQKNRTKTTNIKPDGFYSNWIVKLSPADPNWKKDDHTWHRIMCEDLGSTDDFDFNDLVYDVYFTNDDAGHYTAHIKVQASGGILPIYVGTYTENDAYEAHQILQDGNAQMSAGYYVPVNVAIGVTTDPADEFTFEMKDKNGNWYDATKGTDPDYIPILVTSKDKSRQEAAQKNTFILPESGNSIVPQKICIDGNLIDATKVRWMLERQQIETSYERFDDWATDPAGVESVYHFGKSQDWTKDPVNTGHLHK